MSCRSTRSCRSRGCRSPSSTWRSVFQGSMSAMASLNAFSIDWRSLSVQRRMKGNSARLRAKRMRLEMTISLCGPEPRSHSPQRLAMSSSFLAISSSFLLLIVAWPLSRSLALALRRAFFLFQLTNLIANLGSPFVVFLLLGVVHLAAEANQLGVLIGATAGTPGMLADVVRLAVDIGDQRRQLALEIDIVVR